MQNIYIYFPTGKENQYEIFKKKRENKDLCFVVVVQKCTKPEGCISSGYEDAELRGKNYRNVDKG